MVNSQPMGFYAPAQLIRDARDHGVEVRPADVNASDWDCTLERDALCSRDTTKESQPAVRLGMRLIRGLPEAAGRAIMAARTQPFRSVGDLTTRAQLGRGAVQRLAEAGALASLAANRRAALWQALDQTPRVEELPLLAGFEQRDVPAPAFTPLSRQEEVYADYATSGLTLDAHPVSFFREQLNELTVTPAAQLGEWPHGKNVTVAGLVLMRQRPGTAKGITFVTLEDETGIANLIVHANTWQRFELAARRATALIASGRLERKDRVVHVIVTRLEDMQTRLTDLRHHSRDFR
jgi:error-prone DNA polymerase